MVVYYPSSPKVDVRKSRKNNKQSEVTNVDAVASFVRKLYQMVEDESDDVVCWVNGMQYRSINLFRRVLTWDILHRWNSFLL